MNEKKMTVEDILKMMAENLGEEPRPMVLMSKLIPEWIPRQAQGRQFVMELPNIPPKYKHLMMVATAVAAGSSTCTTTYIKLARRAGATNEEIAETLLVARFALGSTVFATAIEGMAHLVGEA